MTRSHVYKKPFNNPFAGLNPKTQVWEGIVWYISKDFEKKAQKIDFSEEDNFL